MTLAIGLDVGGTWTRARLVDTTNGAVVASVDADTRASRGGAFVLATCADAVSTLVEQGALDPAEVPVGVAACELVAPDGSVSSAASFDWRPLDIAGSFPGHRVAVESDVRAAATAEATFGAGAAHASFVYLTVGTGVACSLVLDGTPHRGARGNALVLGVPPVELTAGGKAIAAAAGVACAEEVFALPTGAAIVERAATALGRAMAWLVNALDPEVVVVGGGLGLRRDYRDMATEVMRRDIEAESSRSVPVVPAACGVDAGAIGAAIVAVDRRPPGQQE